MSKFFTTIGRTFDSTGHIGQACSSGLPAHQEYLIAPQNGHGLVGIQWQIFCSSEGVGCCVIDEYVTVILGVDLRGL